MNPHNNGQTCNPPSEFSAELLERGPCWLQRAAFAALLILAVIGGMHVFNALRDLDRLTLRYNRLAENTNVIAQALIDRGVIVKVEPSESITGD